MGEFKYNKETGILEYWEKDKKVGEVYPMENDVAVNNKQIKKEENHGKNH